MGANVRIVRAGQREERRGGRGEEGEQSGENRVGRAEGVGQRAEWGQQRGEDPDKSLQEQVGILLPTWKQEMRPQACARWGVEGESPPTHLTKNLKGRPFLEGNTQKL